MKHRSWRGALGFAPIFVVVVVIGYLGWPAGVLDLVSTWGTGLARKPERAVHTATTSEFVATERAPQGTLAEMWIEASDEHDEARQLERLSRLVRLAQISEVRRLLGWVGFIRSSTLRLELRRRLLSRWVHADGTAAANYLRDIPELEERSTLIGCVLSEWAAIDPAAAVGWLAVTPAAEWLHDASVSLGKALARQPRDAVHTFIAEIPDEATRIAVCEAIVDQWGNVDPAAAAELVSRCNSGQMQSDLLGRVLSQWAQSDLPGAVRWLQQLSPGTAQDAALAHLRAIWSEVDPEGASRFAVGLSPPNEQFMVTLADQWAQRDPKAAAAWALQLPDSSSKNRALIALAAAWALQDPSASLRFALGLPAGDVKQDAIISVVSAWAAKSPALAADWVTSLPSDQHRAYAVETVFTSWIGIDPIAAVAWLQRLPHGADRDAALNGSAGSMLDTYPDLAVRLARGIGDEGMRFRQMARAIRAWLALDPETARAWIQGSDFPSEQKRRFLGTAPRG